MMDKVEKQANAIEKDAGQEFPGLRQSLKEMHEHINKHEGGEV